MESASVVYMVDDNRRMREALAMLLHPNVRVVPAFDSCSVPGITECPVRVHRGNIMRKFRWIHLPRSAGRQANFRSTLLFTTTTMFAGNVKPI